MRYPFLLSSLAVFVFAASACGVSSGSDEDSPSGGRTTSASGGAAGGVGTGGAMSTSGNGGGGDATTSGGTSSGGSTGMGGASAGGTSSGGTASGGKTGEPPASGGMSGKGGAGATGGAPPTAGSGGGTPYALDCGAEGWAVESHGPPKNRVNYLILGDGYTATTVNTTLEQHVRTMLKRRFEHESGQPYARYRKFVNICVMKAVSASDGIGNGPTAFGGGNGGDRLAAVDEAKVNAYIKAKVPASFEIDWKAVVLNQNKWENTGSALMLWSGAHAEAAGAALHEGGHGFHGLADEYCAKATGESCGKDSNLTGTMGMEYQEVNSTGNPMTTDNKWNLWLGSVQKGLNVPDQGATGLQSTFVGSRYVDSAQYRPSGNSMMNSLFTMALNTSFNSVSREQIVFSIWRAVVPIDSVEPPAGAANNPKTLQVNVIDPAVINVDWTIDDDTHVDAGTTFSTETLSPGSHTISARAYDNATMDLVRNRSGKCPPSVRSNYYCHGTSWPRSEQTVTWTVTKL